MGSMSRQRFSSGSMSRRRLSSGEILQSSLISSEVVEWMETCKNLLTEGSPLANKKVQQYINAECTENVKEDIVRWEDEHGLNLIHYAIIYRRPEIVQYLLHDSKVFPVDSQPSICPYAHLAAYIGSTRSISIILTHRPNDFFKGYLPKHEIKLPPNVLEYISTYKHRGKKVIDLKDLMKNVRHFRSVRIREFDDMDEHNKYPDDIEDLITYLKTNDFDNKQLIKKENPKRVRAGGEIKRIIAPTSYKTLFKVPAKKPTITSIGKTPLLLAAEECNSDTIKQILQVQFSKRKGKRRLSISDKKDNVKYLTSATKSMSPEAIVTLLESGKIELEDYQCACLEAIRQLLPDCLIALLSKPPYKVSSLFAGMNFYHMIYSQYLDAMDDRYNMLPVMTNALIYCDLDVNDAAKSRTFPLYSLLTISFNVESTQMLFPIFECLKYLLLAKANPNFDETAARLYNEKYNIKTSLGRDLYTSAYNCIFENAYRKFLECRDSYSDPRVPQVLLKSSVLMLLKMSKISRRVCKEVLFEYLEKACHFGLDKKVTMHLLMAGADANETKDDRFPINFYFDTLFKVYPHRHRNRTDEFYQQEMEVLLIVCRWMRLECLRKSVRLVLKQYTRCIPLGVIAVTRYFFFLADKLIKEKEASEQKSRWSPEIVRRD